VTDRIFVKKILVKFTSGDILLFNLSSVNFKKFRKILKMKRLFNPRKKSEEGPPDTPNTLDRIVKDKEGVKKRLEEEEKEFMNKKKEYERKMIEFEKQEVIRREQEIAEKKAALDDLKRKNLMVQDKVQEQIKTLHMKLEELKVEHRTNEANTEGIISSLNSKLSEVQRSLSQRMEHFGEDENFPSAPEYGEDDERSGLDIPTDLRQASLYPSLHNLPTMPRSISLHAVEIDQGNMHKKGGNSLGSSPQISLDSSISSRSNTPKLDSDTSI